MSNPDSRLEVHVAGVCFDGDRIIAAKRADNRRIYPGKWECGGGAVEPCEGYDAAIEREMREEFGAIVKAVAPVSVYTIPVSGRVEQIIPGIKFACVIQGYENGNAPSISREHTRVRLVSLDDLDDLDFIPGIPDEARLAYKLLTDFYGIR